MGFRRSVATLLTAAAALAACTSTRSSHTTQPAGTAVTSPATAYPPPPGGNGDVRPPDALVGHGRTVLQRVVVGGATTEAGAVTGVAAVFAPGTSQFVAGALVLADAPATADATVTWSVETNVGERTLFATTATVQPRSVLLSRAKSSGPLAEGIYRVRVTIGSESRDAIFAVSPVAAVSTNDAAQNPLSRLRHRTQPPTTPPIDTSALTLTSDGTSDVPPAACFDDQTLPECVDWFEATPPTTFPPCPAGDKPTLSIDQELVTLGGEASIRAKTSYCKPANGLAIAAAVATGSPQQVAQGGADTQWSGNTCDLPGSSDLFGDVVQAAASTDNASRQATTSMPLREFGPIAGVPVVEPPLGQQVTDLQTISFTAFAIAFGATRGIKSLDVTGPDGTVLAHAGRAGPASACDLTMTRFQAFGAGSYTVQQDGKSVVELMLRAETFDGSITEYPLRWPKKPSWSGALRWRISQPVPAGTQYQDMSADVIVSETGPNLLTGALRADYTQTLDLSTCPSNTLASGSADGTLAGSLDSAGMHLIVTPGTTTAPALGPCPSGGPPGEMGNPLTFAQLAQLFETLAPLGNGRYSATLDVTVPSGQYPFRAQARLTLVPLGQDPVDDAAFSMSPAIPPAP